MAYYKQVRKHDEEIRRGRLVKLKKSGRVTLSLEVTIEVEPTGGELKIRVAAAEVPKILPKRASAGQ